MICPNCKNEIPEDSLFCPECGAKSGKKGEIPKEPGKSKGKRNLGIIIGGLLGICLIFAIAHTLIKPEINLNEYLTVSFNGYDTAGSATAKFDTERFQEEYRGKLRSSFVSDYLDWSLDPIKNLSNGDLVQLSWDCEDEDVLSRYGYKLKHEDASYTVEGLKEITTFDPFEGVDVIFDGISENGTAEITGNPSEAAAQDLEYELDKTSALKEGDTVTLSVTRYGSDPSKYCIENYGMKPATLAKTYTVSGLSQYVQSLAEISSDGLADMKAQAQDVFNAYVAEDWSDTETLVDFTYVGNYLLTQKGETSYSPNNECYLVYKVTIQHNYGGYSTTDEIYWFLAFEDLLVKPDGTLQVELTDYSRPGNRVNFERDENGNGGWWYYGYATLDELYKDVVTSNLAEFNHEDGVTLN